MGASHRVVYTQTSHRGARAEAAAAGQLVPPEVGPCALAAGGKINCGRMPGAAKKKEERMRIKKKNGRREKEKTARVVHLLHSVCTARTRIERGQGYRVTYNINVVQIMH